MENKFNIEEVNVWLKEEYGMSYDELSKEFNKAVDLLSESLKQRKEMRNKIENATEILEEMLQRAKIDKEYCLYDYGTEEILEVYNALKEDE